MGTTSARDGASAPSRFFCRRTPPSAAAGVASELLLAPIGDRPDNASVPSFTAPPPPARPIRLIIADDHPVVRAGVRAMLAQAPEVTIIGEAADGQEALTLVRRLAPDVLLLDLAMPLLEGIGVLQELQDVSWRGRTIVLTSGITREQKLEAL